MITTTVIIGAIALLGCFVLAYWHRDTAVILGLLVCIIMGAIAVYNKRSVAVAQKRSPDHHRIMTAYQTCREHVARDVCIKQAIDRVDSAPEGITLVLVMQDAYLPISSEQLLQLRARVESFAAQDDDHRPLKINDEKSHAQQPTLSTNRG